MKRAFGAVVTCFMVAAVTGASTIAAAAPPKCFGRTATIVGGPGDNRITGTPRQNVIVGLDGNDIIQGRGAGDRICGGRGRDVLGGMDGIDRLNGGKGRDRLDERSTSAGKKLGPCGTVSSRCQRPVRIGSPKPANRWLSLAS